MSEIILDYHQVKGRNELLVKQKWCLFHGLGTGKTYTTLSALAELPACRVLVAAPKAVITGVWLKETEAFDISKHEIEYINYEKISRDREFHKKSYDCIILDEVHKLKSLTSKISKIIRRVSSRATYVWGLTGTPMANFYDDIYVIFKNMSINEFDMNHNEFIERYYNYYTMNTGAGFSIKKLTYPKRNRFEELTTRIRKHSSLVETDAVLRLPGMKIHTIDVYGMDGEKYKETNKGVWKTELGMKTLITLEKDGKLHQLANGFYYDEAGRTVRLENNYKFEELKNLLEVGLKNKERIVVVYYYQADLELLKTLPYTWTEEPDDFENCKLLFRQMNRSEGINLQYLSNGMVLYSYNENYINYDQITKRIYRRGQEKEVDLWVLCSKNTRDEKKWWALKNKKSRDDYLKEILSDE